MLRAPVAGAQRWFCCAGCVAVAQTIHGAGLESFYRFRTELGQPLDDADGSQAQARALFGRPDVEALYVRTIDADTAEVSLTLDNLRCAACVWLCEQHLERQPGVVAAHVNHATGRARVRWKTGRTDLAGVLDAFAAIGYRAAPFQPGAANDALRRAKRGLLLRMAVAMLCMMQVMMYAWPLYRHEASIEPGQWELLRWTSLVLTLPVVLYSAWPLMQGAWRGLRHRRPGMDLPVVIGILAAFAASVAATVAGRGEVYFDSVTMFVALLLAARYLELVLRHDAQDGGRALAAQLPALCTRLPGYPAAAAPELVALPQVRPGDVLRIGPGEAVPADGTLLEGATRLDEAMLTGESLPVAKAAGDGLVAGSFNTGSPVLMRVEQVGSRTRLAGIIHALDRALEEKPRIALLADRIAVVFVAALIALALVTGAVWWWLEPARALPVMIAVLVVSCPCALSLATPAALAAATSRLARRGVLVVKGHALETLAQVTDVVLDKTGTLTQGRFALAHIETMGPLDAARCLDLAAAMETGSTHPVGLALAAAAHAQGRPLPALGRATHLAGQGVEAEVDGLELRLGSARFTGIGSDTAPAGETAATHVWLASPDRPLARFVLQDALRDDSRELLAALRAMGKRVHLVSGDAAATVRQWADDLSIGHCAGGVSPEGKQDYVARLQAGGAVVLAVGDGINDAPQLGLAQVSMAVAAGTALARASADVLLNGQGIMGVAHALDAARRTRRVVRQNLGWALAYNLSFIPLAASGWISAWMAALGMSLSSLLVVGNAWRLRR
ncbi:putative copper-importing P-type ATPase A [Pigmentiphaga humi]|uniref:Putative copper-importing P-type ATPase A n=1 Tax=Pigmentiphaga humi TaxID=2478468 RepID=A0A3P4AYC0_9BURK|nr:putative copper-importing P-type ATPase A [Pigmentiphaga humi]